MKNMRAYLALATVIALVAPASGTDNSPRFSRVTPEGLAYRKTKDSIVPLKVQKTTSRKDAIGTGVSIDERGFVVTNRHVVAGAVEVKVTLNDDTSYAAEIDFEDGANDIAVVKIQTSQKLKALPFAPSSDVERGE